MFYFGGFFFAFFEQGGVESTGDGCIEFYEISLFTTAVVSYLSNSSLYFVEKLCKKFTL
jgi:hypothetical protein